MATWIWIVIAVAIVLVVCLTVARVVAARRRTRRLQQQFGPEYDRTTRKAGGRRKAEAELKAREKRHEKLDIRPLPAEERERFAAQWGRVQADFVDSPPGAVARADALVSAVMTQRGYPVEEFDRRAADVSVEHPRVVENYRAAHGVFVSMENGEVSTEQERQAMKHYRLLFDELLDDGPDRERTGTPESDDTPAATAPRS
jgi:hypothetical protein